MMAEHSALPWHVDGKRVRHNRERSRRTPAVADCDMTHGLGEAGLEDIANAEFIVRAVNSHDALLAELKAAIGVIRTWHDMGMGSQEAHAWALYQASPEMQRINAAIAAAEASEEAPHA